MREVNRTLRWSWLLASAALLTLASLPIGAQETPAAPAAAPKKPAPASYTLRKGDQIAVAISPQKEYDCEAVVLPDGNVFLRNIGTFVAESKTLEELAQTVKITLSEELVKPKVTITLLRMAEDKTPKPIERRFVIISGAVATPGPIEFEEGLSIQRALVLAGGLLREANPQDIRVYPRLSPVTAQKAAGAAAATVGDQSAEGEKKTPPDPKTRKGTYDEKGRYFKVVLPDDALPLTQPAAAIRATGTPESIRTQNEDLELWEGDAVEVRLKPVQPQSTVRLTGLVRTPGLVPLTNRMRLEDLFKEGGLSPLADPKRVQVFRNGDKPAAFDKNGNRLPEFTIDLQAEVQKEPFKKFQLQADDEVFVPQVVGKVILIGGVQNPGWRPLKKLLEGPGTVDPAVANSPAPMPAAGTDGKTKRKDKVEFVKRAPVPADADKWQTIRDFFLQNDKEITAGNQDLPTTYNPNLADLKEVEVIRRGGEEKYRVNLIEVTRDATREDNLWLMPGDVIYLPPKGRPNRGPLYYLRDLPYLGFLFGMF